MAKKITLDNLQTEIDKILNEYEGQVQSNLNEITKRVGKAGTQALKNESLSKFPDSKKHKKRYGKTWTSKTETNRIYTRVIIYSNMPGLPHLLEYGHAKRGGGRVKGKVHIETVERQVVKEFESEVKSKL